jgi:sugar phosphate isomerase/epimerase
MTTRRDFLMQAGLMAAATSLAPISDLMAEMGLKNKMGIQLFSLPKMLSDDFEAGIKMLAKMGYKELELFGPFPFSTEAAQKSWASVTPMLGFSGSGYFGKTIQEVKKILADNGLICPATHTDLDTLETKMEKLGEAAAILGHKYVTLPAIPNERRKTLDDYKKMADSFNKIGENAKKNGIRFGYHNHGYGIKPMDGQIPLQLLLEQTDPNLVFFELDVFWTASGGANPIDYLSKYPNRYKMLHLKDMKEKKEFSGDGGDASQWIPLFSNMTTAGDGVMDLKGIVKKAKEIGVEHYFIEQDMVTSPEIALKRSFDNLKKEVC